MTSIPPGGNAGSILVLVVLDELELELELPEVFVPVDDPAPELDADPLLDVVWLALDVIEVGTPLAALLVAVAVLETVAKNRTISNVARMISEGQTNLPKYCYPAASARGVLAS